MTLSGGCQCGAVRYELAKLPRRASICHCRMCQRATGSYFAPLANVELKDFRITNGELAIYRSSPVAERGYCARCGSPLTFKYCDEDDISVTIGSLDDPDAVMPSRQFGVESTSRHFADLAALPGETTEQSMPQDWLDKIEKSQ